KFFPEMKIPRFPHLLLFALTFFALSCKEESKITTSSPEALKAYNEGVSQLDKFYFSEAKTSLESAVQLDSNFALATARLALVHWRSANEVEAKKEIDRALAKSVHASKYEQMFIRLLHHLIDYRNVEAGRVADSLISQYPRMAEPYVLRGGLYELSKHYDAALSLYKQAAAVDTGYAPAAMSLGYAYSARGDEEKAISAMSRYIHLVPDAADPRASFGDILLRAGHYDEALQQYRKSLELKPDYWYAINRIGDVYGVLGRLNEAEEQYEEGLSKMLPNNQARANYFAAKAELDVKRGSYQKALHLYDEALALDSLGGRAAYGRANALIKLNMLGEAEEMAAHIRRELERRNLAESGAMMEFHVLRARIFAAGNQFDDARAACDSAMLYGSKFNRSLVNLELAKIYLREKEFDDAISSLEEVLHFNANSPAALLLLTKTYNEMGDKELTIEIGNRLRELWKNADKDFQDANELKKILSKVLTTSPASA
ncbi:MAG: tetratricopeptide repeat protein, partial [bacterium]